MKTAGRDPAVPRRLIPGFFVFDYRRERDEHANRSPWRMGTNDATGYHYGGHGDLGHHHAYLLPVVRKIIAETGLPKRIFDLGCGNGSVAGALARDGFQLTGVDPSVEGVSLAKQLYPHLRLEVGSAYDDLASKFGKFPTVISLEVIEHVYDPRSYARTLFSLVEPDGMAIVSTPYHSYLKNLVLAVTGKMDSHFTALWDHGHIKFWSVNTLEQLLRDAGFQRVYFERVGRIPALAKSMIAIARS